MHVHLNMYQLWFLCANVRIKRSLSGNVCKSAIFRLLCILIKVLWKTAYTSFYYCNGRVIKCQWLYLIVCIFHIQWERKPFWIRATQREGERVRSIKSLQWIEVVNGGWKSAISHTTCWNRHKCKFPAFYLWENS